jgi:hypothetical protein
VTRRELDQLYKAKADLERSLWQLKQLIDSATVEHATEDRANTSLEQSQRGKNAGRPV